MIEVVPFRAWHFDGFVPQVPQAECYRLALASSLPAMEHGLNFTVLDAGVPIASGGAVDQTAGRCTLWAFLSTLVRPRHFVAIHRRVRQFVDEVPFRRIEAAVDVEFVNGHRWMQALGLEREGLMRAYAHGRDHVLYARVK